MKVKEAIEELKKLDGELQLVKRISGEDLYVPLSHPINKIRTFYWEECGDARGVWILKEGSDENTCGKCKEKQVKGIVLY